MATTHPSPAGALVLLALSLAGAASCTTRNPLYSPRVDAGWGAEVGGPTRTGGRGGSGDGGVSGSGGQGGAPGPVGGSGGIAGTPNAGGMSGGSSGGLGGGSGSGGGGVTPDVGGPMMDTGGAGATGGDAGPGDTAGPGNTACGPGVVNRNVITNATGIAVAADGAIYYARENAAQLVIGRVDRLGNHAATWAQPPTPIGNARPRTMRVDSDRRLLFVVGAGTQSVFAVALDGADFRWESPRLISPHGVAVRDDGYMLVTMGDGSIVRMKSDLGPPELTTVLVPGTFTTANRPLGIAVSASGDVYVGSSGGRLYRFRQSPAALGLVDSWTVGTLPLYDVAIDVDGRVYVSEQAPTNATGSLRSVAGGVTSTVTAVSGRLSALAFARGTLNCGELIIGDLGAAAKVWSAPRPGLRIP